MRVQDGTKIDAKRIAKENSVPRNSEKLRNAKKWARSESVFHTLCGPMFMLHSILETAEMNVKTGEKIDDFSSDEETENNNSAPTNLPDGFVDRIICLLHAAKFNAIAAKATTLKNFCQGNTLK